MVCTAQAVPREYQLTFGCTHLQELEYFCMLQSTQQLLGVVGRLQGVGRCCSVKMVRREIRCQVEHGI